MHVVRVLHVKVGTSWLLHKCTFNHFRILRSTISLRINKISYKFLRKFLATMSVWLWIFYNYTTLLLLCVVKSTLRQSQVCSAEQTIISRKSFKYSRALLISAQWEYYGLLQYTTLVRSRLWDVDPSFSHPFPVWEIINNICNLWLLFFAIITYPFLRLVFLRLCFLWR